MVSPTPTPTAPSAPSASLIIEEEEIPHTEELTDTHVIDMPERTIPTILPQEVRKESGRKKKKKKND